MLHQRRSPKPEARSPKPGAWLSDPQSPIPGLESNDMNAIRYEAPTSVSETLRLMAADPDASLMAGGTDLLVQFRAGLKRPTAFIDLKRIPELSSVSLDVDGLRLGAAVSAAE